MTILRDGKQSLVQGGSAGCYQGEKERDGYGSVKIFEICFQA